MGDLHVTGGTHPLAPQLRSSHCRDWMQVGRNCPHGYGECDFRQSSYDRMTDADKKIQLAYVIKNDSLHFNKRSVRTLPQQARWKLGDANGPEGTRPAGERD